MYTHIFKNCNHKNNYVSHYSHSSIFIVRNFKIWVYKGMEIHFLLVTLKLPQIDFFEIGNLPQTNPFHTTKIITSTNNSRNQSISLTSVR